MLRLRQLFRPFAVPSLSSLSLVSVVRHVSLHVASRDGDPQTYQQNRAHNAYEGRRGLWNPRTHRRMEVSLSKRYSLSNHDLSDDKHYNHVKSALESIQDAANLGSLASSVPFSLFWSNTANVKARAAVFPVQFRNGEVTNAGQVTYLTERYPCLRDWHVSILGILTTFLVKRHPSSCFFLTQAGHTSNSLSHASSLGYRKDGIYRF